MLAGTAAGTAAAMAGRFTPGGDPGTSRGTPAGLPPARLDQLYRPPAPQMAPGAAAGTFKGRQVIVYGTGPGVGIFVYNGAPGPGTLVESITQASADPYGNHTIPGGDAVYNNAGGVAVLFGSAGMRSYHGSLAGGWSLFGSSGVTFDSAGDVNVGANATLTLSAAAGVVHPTTLKLLGGGLTLSSGAWEILMPSGDTTGATDAAAINNALGTGPVVLLLPGVYYGNVPVVVPDGAVLAGMLPSWGIPSANYGAGGVALQGAILQPGSSTFTGSALISLGSAGTVQHGGQVLAGITIAGTGLPAANTVNGIESVGYVGGVRLTDVTVWGNYNGGATTGLGGHGLYCHNDGTAGHNPDFWQVRGCKFSACGGYGLETIAMSDSWYVDGECTGNNLGGANIQNGATSRMIGWRCNNNATLPGTPGLAWSGLTGFTGKFVVDGGCDFSANGVGIAVAGAGTGTITMHAPVADGNTTQYTYAGTNHVESDAAYNVSTAAPTFA